MLTGFGCKKQLSDQNLTTVKSNVKLAGLASVAGDVVGKITVGYQGWFSRIGDGFPITNGWWHWSSGSDAPNTGNIGINAWPDTRELQNPTQLVLITLVMASLQVCFLPMTIKPYIDIHFKWMQDNGIDVSTLQRFDPTGGEGPFRDAMTVKVRKAAEAHYVCFSLLFVPNFQY